MLFILARTNRTADFREISVASCASFRPRVWYVGRCYQALRGAGSCRMTLSRSFSAIHRMTTCIAWHCSGCWIFKDSVCCSVRFHRMLISFDTNRKIVFASGAAISNMLIRLLLPRVIGAPVETDPHLHAGTPKPPSTFGDCNTRGVESVELIEGL